MATKRAFLAVTEAPLMGLVTKVKLSFNPFDPRSIRARTALGHLSSKTLKKANPKYTIETNITDADVAPQLEITYIDNSTKKFDVKKELDELVLDMHKHNLHLGQKGVSLPFDPEASA